MTSRVASIIPTGVANLASIRSALGRVGLDVRLAEKPSDLARADVVVLPGVGSFDAGRRSLAASGFDAALTRRIEADLPVLAICLGFQLLLQGSDESVQDQPGLGIFEGRAERFPASVRVPHLGWNEITAPLDAPSMLSGAASFAHSFCLRQPPASGISSICTYDRPFVAALERGNLLACQFHPELSGSFGRALLERFCTRTLWRVQ